VPEADRQVPIIYRKNGAGAKERRKREGAKGKSYLVMNFFHRGNGHFLDENVTHSI
jgi:hypothetical protein